ncbi:TIGR03084 family metal-binding protein [Streptomyces sp. NPDC054784]
MRAEGDDLDRLVARLPPGDWRSPTPAPGWTVAHQIAHLLWTDRCALLAVRDADAFRRETEKALAAPHAFVDDGAAEGAALPPAELLDRWRRGRAELGRALGELPRGVRVPWFGPPMSGTAMATARLMETWAHGEDVAEALGVRRAPTVRLRHVAWIGVRTRDFAYVVRGLEPPGVPFRVELDPPEGLDASEGPDTSDGGGAVWAYGPEDAAQRVTGPAVDFCRLVTQRVHRDDTALTATGADADRWLDLAQAFAGPPGPGRAPHGGTAAARTGEERP